MPVIHIYTAERFLSPARKKLMIENVTRAAVEAEGLPTTDRTYVLIHDVPDGGWGWQGEPITHADFAQHLPPDPPPTAPVVTTTKTPSARSVASRYIERVSAGDLDGVVALFRPDATLLHPLGQFAGDSAIRAFYADNILPRGLQLTAVSFVADGPFCVFELEARASTDVTFAIDHLTVDADGRIERLAIYYR